MFTWQNQFSAQIAPCICLPGSSTVPGTTSTWTSLCRSSWEPRLSSLRKSYYTWCIPTCPRTTLGGTPTPALWYKHSHVTTLASNKNSNTTSPHLEIFLHRSCFYASSPKYAWNTLWPATTSGCWWRPFSSTRCFSRLCWPNDVCWRNTCCWDGVKCEVIPCSCLCALGLDTTFTQWMSCNVNIII